MMEDIEFRAMVVEELEPDRFARLIKTKKISQLQPGDVLIKVHYSALNYKDALSARGHKGITRRYPHTPGIDASGIVDESHSDKFNVDDEVLVTGYDLGMNTSGGFSEYIRVPAEWIIKLPKGMTLRDAMIYGTAGFTAGLAINELQKHNIFPGSGKILVTGATGGVGTLAAAMLSKIGYEVSASTGKADKYDFLRKIGTKEILSRDDIADKIGKPLLQGRWIGAIENVGGNTLSNVIRSIKPRGIVACIGNVESDIFETSVYPFILRGVSVIGIDSAERGMEERLKIWERISTKWKLENTELFVNEIGLGELDGAIDKMLDGKLVGKTIIKIDD